MARDWSREEVEAVVADYFAMYAAWMAGLKYSKTEHRNRLRALLDDRTDGSVERKRGNISAVLLELGLPYLDGYKPYSNYQALLYEVVAERVRSASELVTTIAREVTTVPALPTVPDILDALVDGPKPSDRPQPKRSKSKKPLTPSAAVDYLALESRNRDLGKVGELFVMEYERARLLREGMPVLAGRIERISQTLGDRAGFDVLSFKPSGEELFIEVKTTRYGMYTPFYVSRNEVDTSVESSSRYALYRVFGVRETPKLFVRSGSLKATCVLDAVNYVARVA